MISLERTLFNYFEQTKNYIRAMPLNLGGIPGSGGGRGGPPGGFYGYLPQTRVSYDYSEAAASGIPASGYPTLLDNLNHIRYRLDAIESGGTSGRIDLYHNGIIVASGIQQLNLVGTLNVSVSGIYATIEHPVQYTEYFNILVPASGFSTDKIFIEDSLNIYYNGLRQFNTEYSEKLTLDGFTTSTLIPSGSKIVVDYLYYTTLQPGGTSGWGSVWGSMPWGA